MPKKLTIDYIRARALEVGFTLLSDEYVNDSFKLTWICNTCKAISEKRFNSVDQGRGCKSCSYSERKLTVEEVRTKALKFGFILLSDCYVNSKTKLNWTCVAKGHNSFKLFNDIQNGHGCLDCSGLKKHDLKEIKEIGFENGFKFLSGTYVDSKSELEWQCLLCKKSVSKTFAHVKRGGGCYYCNLDRQRLTIHQVRARGLKLGLELLSDIYPNALTNLHWKCKAGHEVFKRLNDIDKSKGCPKCIKTNLMGQEALYKYILTIFPDALQNQGGLLKSPKLELDIYIPSLRKAIELDGEFWHAKPKAIERDSRKNEECKEAGIELLRIPYTKYWLNKSRREKLGKPLIQQFLGLTAHR